MARRRIGVDVTSALTQGGGIGRYTRELFHAVAAAPGDFDFQLFSAKLIKPPAVPDALPKGPRMRYRALPISEPWLYRIWYRARLPLPVQLATGKLDLFHSPDFVLPPVWGGIPTLLTVHDLSFVHFPHVYPRPLVQYLNQIVPWSVKRASHILADSVATKEDLLAIWGVPDEKVTVLYSGVHARFAPVEDGEKLLQVRRRYGLGERPFVLAVGTVQPRKNYQMLIRAFQGVANRLDYNLVIAGGVGWMAEEMTAEAARQGLSDRVLFSGFVEDDDLPALYSAADLLAFPSLYEGFGLPVLEAMACGLPVLLSDTSSLPEVGGAAAVMLAADDEQGWQEAMIQLLGDPHKRLEMQKAGFLQAGQFRWSKAAGQLLDTYDRLTKRD